MITAKKYELVALNKETGAWEVVGPFDLKATSIEDAAASGEIEQAKEFWGAFYDTEVDVREAR